MKSKKPKPAPRPAPKLTAREEAFLEQYAECGNLSRASESSGLDRSAHYKALERKPGYREKFDDADKRFRASLASGKERIASLVPTAITLLERHCQTLLAPPKKWKDRIRLDKADYFVVKDILDRAGYKPKIEVEHSLQAEQLVARLQAARKRVAKK